MSSTAQALRRLPSVRDRCSRVYKLAQEGQVDSFVLDESKYSAVIEVCAAAINRDYGTNYASIGPHSRWRHFATPRDADLLGPVLQEWKSAGVEPMEIARRLIDLFVVSVLVDGALSPLLDTISKVDAYQAAGAGNVWTYQTKSGETVRRSEGLAVASLEMFLNGLFADDPKQPHRVTAGGLSALDVPKLSDAFQVTTENAMSGLEGRSNLLIRLGHALQSSHVFVQNGLRRPGNMLDHLSPSDQRVRIEDVWTVVMDGFAPVWPASRTQLDGVSLGDAWPCASLARANGAELGSESSIVPFHKLSQWLTYSLLEPMQAVLGWQIVGGEVMTGLPEYRNGGLLVDLGVLSLTDKAKADAISVDSKGIYKFAPSSQTVIEWRAITVIALDIIAQRLRDKLEYDFTLPQILESATWKCGRQIAAERRENGGPPIEIESDGTIF